MVNIGKIFGKEIRSAQRIRRFVTGLLALMWVGGCSRNVAEAAMANPLETMGCRILDSGRWRDGRRFCKEWIVLSTKADSHL
jgi:hypothetical protein